MSKSLPWVEPHEKLPDPSSALDEPDGLVAAGLDLSTTRLEEAYSNGLFPWFSEGQPVLWWSPDPRMVLYTDELHLSHSLRKRLRQIEKHSADDTTRHWTITTDLAFDAVMQGCAQRGTDQVQDTWINPAMCEVYRHWHAQGVAHSIEVWASGALIGGLYGVALGRVFFGESMFTRATDASKVALVYLIRYLQQQSVPLIDCQMQTEHLGRLGGRPIPREKFLAHVRVATQQAPLNWPTGQLHFDGTVTPATF